MKKLLINTGLLVVIFSITSCKKYLETLPDNRTVITTPEQVSQLLVKAYPHSTYMLFCEALSDNAEEKGNSSQGVDPQTYLINVQTYKYQDVQNVSSDSPVAYWDSCYAAIAAANQALAYCSGPDSANFTAQKGEALVCRAYAHFMLVTLFAKAYDPATAANFPGVPYVKTVSTHVFDTYDRGTVASVYANIESDLTQGMALIQDKSYGTTPKFHFTLEAAHAFASRFYLFKRDYAKAVAHSTAVFGSSDPASLLRDQTTIYNTLQYNDIKILYNSSFNNANILLQEVSSAYPYNYYNYRYGYGQKLYSMLFYYDNVTGGSYSMSTYGATPQYYNFPKFDQQVVPLLSMEEVLLNRAEANIYLKNYDAAIADLNAWISKNISDYDPAKHNVTPGKITSFYGLPQDAAMVAAVLDCKRISYFQEGLRWFDILRLRIPVVHEGNGFSITLGPDDNRRMLQLPAEVVNEGMQLNPR